MTDLRRRYREICRQAAVKHQIEASEHARLMRCEYMFRDFANNTELINTLQTLSAIHYKAARDFYSLRTALHKNKRRRLTRIVRP